MDNFVYPECRKFSRICSYLFWYQMRSSKKRNSKDMITDFFTIIDNIQNEFKEHNKNTTMLVPLPDGLHEVKIKDGIMISDRIMTPEEVI